MLAMWPLQFVSQLHGDKIQDGSDLIIGCPASDIVTNVS